MNTYPGTAEHVVDADTLDCDLDLGFSVRTLQRLRLMGLNTAEKNTPKGKEANAYVADWLAEHGPTLIIQTHRKEKYGRWLATVTTDDGACLNTDLIESGHAAPYDGHGPLPIPESKE
ncbi:thermonuclease family protein [Streptomyces sp. NPDC005799]|uniref:thermonuclease family protein n=1 Tax=Streptomyces sp. NPDC005799 TaxID=3154678 RepID=UPI0033FFD624